MLGRLSDDIMRQTTCVGVGLTSWGGRCLIGGWEDMAMSTCVARVLAWCILVILVVMTGAGLHCHSHSTVALGNVLYRHSIDSSGSGSGGDALHGLRRHHASTRASRAEGGGDVTLVRAGEVAWYRRRTSNLIKGLVCEVGLIQYRIFVALNRSNTTEWSELQLK